LIEHSRGPWKSVADIASLVVRNLCRPDSIRSRESPNMPTTKLNKRSPKWYGWLPDLPDQRDFSYSVVAPRLAALPAKVDLRSKCSPIENQGDSGACTAHALVGALEFVELKDWHKLAARSLLFC